MSLLLVACLLNPDVVRVTSLAELRAAFDRARPGTEIVIAAGTYEASFFGQDRHGTQERPIVIRGESAASAPRFIGWQLSSVSHLHLRDLQFRGAKSNGLNIDDGRKPGSSHHLRLERIQVSDLPTGNHDGIKLSGLDDFEVIGATIERWGGSAIDMVGCHRGMIRDSTFRQGGDNGVQAKGGSSDIRILNSRFERPGHRGVNLGGSTGLEFFRPKDASYEAKNLTVERCVFVGGVSPVAFVGVDGAVVRNNTIYRPERWALRILQESTAPRFVPSRNGVFEKNIVVWHSGSWASGGVNVGGGTAPETFRFEGNFWFCFDQPARSRPQLPTPETGGTYGVDPMLTDAESGDFRLRPGSRAAGVGANPS